jgi:hypothetical protein
MNTTMQNTPRMRAAALGAAVLVAALAAAGSGAAVWQEPTSQPQFRVTVKDEKPVQVALDLPVDPMRRINFQPQGMLAGVTTEKNETLHLGVSVSLHMDGQVRFQGQGARAEYINRPLGKGKDGKEREGFSSSYVYPDNLHITATVTVVPTRAQGKTGKRRRDAVLTHYLIENKGTQPHKVGLRMRMDTFIIDNDGCLFAAPTVPGKVLDGVALQGKTLPPYVQLLQRPDLKNPGFVAHLTLDLGPRLEKPDRVVLTNLGAGGIWDVPAQPANGDSAMALFWDPKEIKPGGKREFAYGYGQGVVPNPDGEGQMELVLGGSFVPGKVFSVAARVSDPATGQSLKLELPEGVALLEGREEQPVPQLQGEEPYSVVYWRAQVSRPGEFAVRVRSSTGLTQGKLVSVVSNKN